MKITTLKGDLIGSAPHSELWLLGPGAMESHEAYRRRIGGDSSVRVKKGEGKARMAAERAKRDFRALTGHALVLNKAGIKHQASILVWPFKRWK